MAKIPFIYFSCDDYGISNKTCKRIDDCEKHGLLNRFSVFPNSNMKQLSERLKNRTTVISIHLNLVEGCAVSRKEDVSLLVDEDNHFKYTFFELFLLSLSPMKRIMKEQIKHELRAQCRRFQELAPWIKEWQLDTHQHVHMIPMIFSALLEVIQEEKYSVTFIRIPVEPISIFFRHPRVLFGIIPINLVKYLVLRGCYMADKKKLMGSGISTALFCGVLYSGFMSEKVVLAVLPDYYRLAEKKNMGIELLFHSGYMKPGEDFFDKKKTCFHPFYTSKGRKVEFQALHSEKIRQELDMIFKAGQEKE